MSEAIDKAREALKPFVDLHDQRTEHYRKRGGNAAAFPDSHHAYEIGADELRLGAWRKAAEALAALTAEQSRPAEPELETTAEDRAAYRLNRPLPSGIKEGAFITALLRDIDRLLSARSPAVRGQERQPTHRHYKGGLYRELKRGHIEAGWVPAVFYENEAGEWIARPVSEFDDTIPTTDTNPSTGEAVEIPRFARLPPARKDGEHVAAPQEAEREQT